MQKSHAFSLSNFSDRMYLMTTMAILTAVTLISFSFLKLCSEACSKAHNYLLFGIRFEMIGFIFFSALAILHLLQKKSNRFLQSETLLFSSALGAELLFIMVQKYQIGSFCPLCLGIATTVMVGTFALVLTQAMNKKEEAVEFEKNGFGNLGALVIGFIIALVGISKYDALEAAQETVQEKLTFGNKSSPVDVYLFTDWQCPACRKLEPTIEALGSTIMAKAKLTFVDTVVHPETFNFIPFNLSFILYDKSQYFKLRQTLEEIAKKTKEPTESQVAAAAAKLGVSYIEPHYSDVAMAVEYYKQLVERFEITETPTMIIFNSRTKQEKRLVGDSEITNNRVSQAMDALL